MDMEFVLCEVRTEFWSISLSYNIHCVKNAALLVTFTMHADNFQSFVFQLQFYSKLRKGSEDELRFACFMLQEIYRLLVKFKSHITCFFSNNTKLRTNLLF
jgi:hypothetical protein